MASIAQVMGAVATHPATAPRTRSPKAVPSRVASSMLSALRAPGPPVAKQHEGPGRDQDNLARCVYEIDRQDHLPGDVDNVDPGQAKGAGDSQDRHFRRVLPSPGGDQEGDRDSRDE